MSQTRQPRPDRPEAGPFIHSRLAEEVERLKTEPAWHDGDRNSITLTKRSGLTLVLTVLRAGAVLREHRAPTAVTLHVISGTADRTRRRSVTRARTGGGRDHGARPDTCS